MTSDQGEKLTALLEGIPQTIRPQLAMLTGDTRKEERERLLERSPGIIGATPELIHYALRGTYWSQPWQQFLANLRYVLLDEAHAYNGAYGANMANLLRRLKLAVDRYGGNSRRLQFIFLSATVGNPSQLARSLSGRRRKRNFPQSDRLVWIHRSGAGMPERELIVVKPTNNPNPDAAKILLFLLRQGLRGICFCNGRATIKNLLATLRTEAASQKYPNIEGQTAIFYGGLTGERRSEIISGLQEGRMRCLLSTSALEAGIDLAELDFALIRGWPGSLQGFRQRIGRAGRKQKGLAIFLPLERSPLDRYYAQHPELLLSAPAERVSFNARYPVDLGKHLMCAAVESGIENDRLKRYFGKTAPHIASALLEQGALRKTRGRLWAKGFPHRDVNFRGGLGGSTVRLTNEQTGEAIEEMSLEIAYREAFPGAIYRTQDSNGKMVTYRSLSLDVEARQATLQPIPETSTYTVAESRTDTRILQDLVAPKQLKLNLSEEEGNAFLRLSWGEVSHSISGYQVLVKEYEQTCLNRKCVNYREALPGRKFCPVCGRRSRRAELTKVVDEVEFEQPYAIRFTTPIAQISFDKVVNEYLQKCASRLLKEVESDSAIAGVLRDYPASLLGVHSFGHQILAAFPLVVLGSLNDVNYIVEARNSKDCVGYFYDLSESGNGSAEAIFRHLSKLARAGAALARNCDCQYGCPKCLILSGCPDGNQALLKQMGLFLCDSIASM